MKELSIEEKAARYDRSLERARDVHTYYCDDREQLRKIEHIFPELAESEDERIRKELIEALKQLDREKCPVDTYHYQDWIDWLEKQGEQKSADKVEPKFKVGDWVVNNNGEPQLFQVTARSWLNSNDSKIKRAKDYSESFINTATLDKQYHLWTIQDAKKGDVLVNDTILIIVDHLGTFENRPIIYSWYFADSKKFYGMGTSEPDRWGVKGFIPATKEQSDLLFQKMKDAGYEWDAEKKELKKIEQKTAWSEEDELHIRELESLVKQVWATAEHKNDKDTIHKMSDLSFFLKTLKPQQKQEWRQDNVEELTEFENVMMHIGCSFFGENAGLDPNDTDAIKKQANLLLELVPKQEWSEEDIEILETCISLMSYNDAAKEETDWLKSLRERYTWKPSDEQMDALCYVTNFDYGGYKATLVSLYEQLKKLKG